MSSDEKELEILNRIHTSPVPVRQRELAEVVGLSLGMTNSILKRLVKKGLLTVKKVNNRNIRYAVSPSGIEAITRRSYRYFKKTIRNVVYYRESIEKLVAEAAADGCTGVFLKGRSDLDFIVEHACREAGVTFVRDPEAFAGDYCTLYAETYVPDAESREAGVHFLQELFVVN